MTNSALAVLAASGIAVALLAAMVVGQGRHLSRLSERVALHDAYGAEHDPRWWSEHLGRDADLPFANDDPDPGPVPCELHPIGKGHRCKRCGRPFRANGETPG